MEIRKQSETFATVDEIVQTMETVAPTALQEQWDNSGLLVGFAGGRIRRILTCLEIDRAVLEEAKERGADMIVTHHPLIFHEIKTLHSEEYGNGLIMDLIGAGISVYSCHTPFDKVKGGNNDLLAKRLGLVSVKNLKGAEVESPSKMIEKQDEADMGRTGKFKKPMRYRQVIEWVAKRLDLSIRQLHAVGDLDAEITSMGICTGAGAALLELAADDCDLFLTGDVTYHQARRALELGICLLDAGHYDTEKYFAEGMKAKLEKKLGDKVEIFASERSLDPFQIL